MAAPSSTAPLTWQSRGRRDRAARHEIESAARAGTNPAERGGLAWRDGVPPHPGPAAVRLHDHRRAEAGGAASRAGRDRPRLRQPRPPVAGRSRSRSSPRRRTTRATTATRRAGASPSCARRSPTSTCAGSASSLDPDTEVLSTIGAKEGFSHLMWVLLQPGDAALVPSPSYPIHIWGPYFAGADARQVPVGTGEDYVANVMEAWELGWPKPRVVVLSFPHNPTTATRRAGRHAAPGRLGPRARRRPGARLRLRRRGVRRLAAAVDPAVRGRQGVRGRALLDDEVVLDGRLAGRLPGRQRRGRRRAGEAEELPRLRHVPADPDRGDRHAERGGRLPEPRSTRSTSRGATP